MMKLLATLTLLLSLPLITLCRQTVTPDLQWYVKNGECMNGGSYANCNISNQVQVVIVSQPDQSCDVNADDDLLAIYTDGTFSLTRGGCNIPFTNNGMNISGPKTIQNLYWTNIYDQDDPPQNIEVSPTSGVNQNLPAYSSNFDIIANHSARPGYDITLVIDNTNLAPNSKLILNEVEVLDPRTGRYSTTYRADAFLPEPFHGNSAVIGASANFDLNGTTQYVEFLPDANSPYTFINLRAGLILNDIADHARVMFRLTSSSVDYSIGLAESILSIHDPNSLQLTDLCKQSDCTTALYEGYFYNRDKINPASDLAIKFTMPPSIVAESIVFTSCTYNGQSVPLPDSIIYDNNNVTCYFDKDLQIRVCPNDSGRNGHVRFAFCTTLKDSQSHRSTIQEQSLALTNTKTVFNAQSNAPSYYDLTYKSALPTAIGGDNETLIELNQMCTLCQGKCYSPKKKWYWWLLSILLLVLVSGLASKRNKRTKNDDYDD